MGKRTKHCQKCHNYIPDENTLCDFHLREKYGLLDKAALFLNDWGTLYPKDVVLAALREAEKRRDEEVAVLATMLKVALKSEREFLYGCKGALAVLILSQEKMIWRRDACIGDAQSILEQAIAKAQDND